MVGWKPFNTEHKLNEYMHIKPVKQKKRGRSPNRNEIACKEVDELIKAGILRKVKDHTWVANPVMGYHQLQMVKGDEDKIAFFTRKGIFCYRKMPFGLKNAGSTYERLVDKSLNGELATLSQFLSKGVEKSLPFFKELKSCTDKKTIWWTSDAEEAF
ncbi:hypothetical protein Tco_0648458 [Tanacetum coccineum]